MSIKFEKGGLLTTVQDFGRYGYQKLGVSPTGAMDTRSFQIANLLVNNDENEAALEVTMMGPVILFNAGNTIAVTGGDLSPQLNGTPVPMYQAVAVSAGDKLSFGGMKTGCRAYIAFAGGLNIPEVMESKSTFLRAGIGGIGGRQIKDGDVIAFLKPGTDLPNLKERKLPQEDYSSHEVVLRAIRGPQDDYFTEQGIKTFFSATYAISQNADRQGYRLEGEKIEHVEDANIISDGIALGAVQVPGNGQPIIMLADRQSLGGYTKIANVITVDLQKLSQCRPGDKVRFEEVDITKAQDLYIAYCSEIRQLKQKLQSLNQSDRRIYRITLDGKIYEAALEGSFCHQ